MLRLWQKQRSSRDEFDQLVRPHVDMLYRTALRMTADSHLAEDLVQETCLRAFRAFETFKKGTNFKAWVFRILSNAAIDNARRNANVTFIEWDDGETGNGGPGAYGAIGRNPEVHVLHQSFMNDAFKAMMRLSPEIRMVVALSILEEFSYDEIAQSVGCPVGTVKSRLSRGRKQLQEELGDYLPVKKQSTVSSFRSVADGNKAKD